MPHAGRRGSRSCCRVVRRSCRRLPRERSPHVEGVLQVRDDRADAVLRLLEVGAGGSRRPSRSPARRGALHRRPRAPAAGSRSSPSPSSTHGVARQVGAEFVSLLFGEARAGWAAEPRRIGGRDHLADPLGKGGVLRLHERSPAEASSSPMTPRAPTARSWTAPTAWTGWITVLRASCDALTECGQGDLAVVDPRPRFGREVGEDLVDPGELRVELAVAVDRLVCASSGWRLAARASPVGTRLVSASVIVVDGGEERARQRRLRFVGTAQLRRVRLRPARPTMPAAR